MDCVDIQCLRTRFVPPWRVRWESTTNQTLIAGPGFGGAILYGVDARFEPLVRGAPGLFMTLVRIAAIQPVGDRAGDLARRPPRGVRTTGRYCAGEKA